MPSWLVTAFSWIFKQLVPIIVEQVKKAVKKAKIKKEVNEEEDAVLKVKKEINEWLEKNPHAKKIPKSLEIKLRDAIRRRNRGLSN